MATLSTGAEEYLKTVSPEASAYVMAQSPGLVNTETAQALTSQFLHQNAGGATQAYSAPNIASTTTAPVTKPNLSDPFGLYAQYMSTPDIVAAQQGAKTAQQALLGATQASRDEQTAIGQRLQSATRIRGAQAYAQQLASNKIAALNEAYTLAASNVDALTKAAQSQYQIALGERENIQNLIAKTGGKAGISYADTYESALQKATDYQTNLEEEKNKQAYKDSLKQTALQLGIKTKGSTGDLEKRLKKYYKSEKEYEKEIKALEKKAKQKALAGTGSSKNEEAETANFYKDANALRNEMASGRSNWAYSFETLKRKYPQASTELVDRALGLDYREKFDKKLDIQMKNNDATEQLLKSL